MFAVQIHAKLTRWVTSVGRVTVLERSLSVQVGRSSNAVYFEGIALVPACLGLRRLIHLFTVVLGLIKPIMIVDPVVVVVMH